MATKIKFDAHTNTSGTVHVGFATVRFQKNKRASYDVALRLDPRGDGVRVDVKTHPLTPWEAVDGGVPQPNLKAAKSFAKSWLERASAQDTLTPV